MEYHQKIVLEKNGDKQHMYYENNNKKIYRELSDKSYNNLFTQFKPNTSFSFPDRLIQHFVKDGTMLPTFKSSLHYNEEDLENTTHNLNKELKYIHNKLHSQTLKKPKTAKKSMGPKLTRKKDLKKAVKQKKNESKEKLLKKMMNANKKVKKSTSSSKRNDKRKTKKGKKSNKKT